MEIRPPIAIDKIAEPTDRFRCEPYNSVLLARACADRQAMSEKPRDQRTGDYVYCVGCKDGPRVLTQLKLLPPEKLVRDPGARRGPSPMVGNGRKRGRPRKNAAAPNPQTAPSKATLAAVAAQPTALPMRPPGAAKKPSPPRPKLPKEPQPSGTVTASEVTRVINEPVSGVVVTPTVTTDAVKLKIKPQRRDGLELGPPAPVEPTAPGASPKQADPIEPKAEAQAVDPLEDFTSEMHRIEDGLLGIEQRTRDLRAGLRALRARLERKP